MTLFDARAIKLLKPGERIIDEAHPGLRIEATATTRTWGYRFKSPVDGLMRQIAIGRWPKVSYERAVVDWEELRAKRDSGVDPAQEKRKARQAEVEAAVAAAAAPAEDVYRVRHLVRDYIAGHIKSHRSLKGQKEVERLLNDKTETIGDVVAADLTRAHTFDLLKGMSATPVLAQQVRAEMGAAYDYGLDSGRLPQNTPNHWRSILRGKLRSKGKKIKGENIGTTKRALSEMEIGPLINWLPNFSRLTHDVLVMYLWTGTRGAESVNIEVDEVGEEADGWWWTVPKRKTKNARFENAFDLRVPLFGRALEVVLRRRAQALEVNSPYLFRARGMDKPITQKTIQTAVFYRQPYCVTSPTDIRTRLPITNWAPHDLRRTARTRLAALGCPDDIAEAVIGHMPGGIKGVYNRHTYDKERQEWLAKLSDHLEELAGRAMTTKA